MSGGIEGNEWKELKGFGIGVIAGVKERQLLFLFGVVIGPKRNIDLVFHDWLCQNEDKFKSGVSFRHIVFLGGIQAAKPLHESQIILW